MADLLTYYEQRCTVGELQIKHGTEQEKELAAPKNRTVLHINLNSDLGKRNSEQCYMERKARKKIYCRNINYYGKMNLNQSINL